MITPLPDRQKKEDYFLRMPWAASRAAPIAATPVTTPTGAAWVVPAAAGVAGIAALAGTCDGAVVTADAADPPDWWIQ